ncbi:hypothetical protein NE236_42980 [Actinoallomurus purpureus]|uniref:hypothetical protein n=1 Tax=Actinoallomurus purpureus TaxID=478114 RepID=UPI002092D97E|nr:hypothetical protein [Actinoallomurus purpureus]MCO6011732.1 hypothetical protein [Actinoallomurus purpureus]
MLSHTAAELIAAANNGPDTKGLATWLQNIFGPLFLSIVGIVALFFLFTREITRFIQFLVLAIVIAVVFYFPESIVSIANGVATALGFKKSS